MEHFWPILIIAINVSLKNFKQNFFGRYDLLFESGRKYLFLITFISRAVIEVMKLWWINRLAIFFFNMGKKNSVSFL